VVPTLSEATLENVPLVAQPLFGTPQREVELREVSAADVAQLTTLQGVPDPFAGIEVRSVARELLQMNPLRGSPGEEVLDRLATVNGGSIPDDEELARDRAQEHAQETHHLGTVVGP
jgi:hypothetical protein